MQTMSSAQPAPQPTVQQISQWWEQQWHVQQPPASQSQFYDQQSLRHQQRQQHQYLLQQQQAHTQLQQQQRQYQLQQQLQRGQLQKPQVKQHAAEQSEGIADTQPASTGITPRQAATTRMEASSKRRRSRPNIVSAAAASPSRAASLRATRNFKAVLAGSRFRKMDSGAELLAQAHTLQSLEHAAAEQAFQQRLHSNSQQPQLEQGVADAGSEAVFSTQSPDSESTHTQVAQPVQSQLSAPQTEGEIALARQQRAAAAQQDMMAVALDVVESQLPLWSSKPTLDWSAQQHLSKFRSQVVITFSVVGFDFAVMRSCGTLFAWSCMQPPVKCHLSFAECSIGCPHTAVKERVSAACGLHATAMFNFVFWAAVCVSSVKQRVYIYQVPARRAQVKCCHGAWNVLLHIQL